MKTLIIIDFQYDFCNPNGTLYVPGAEEAEEAIVKHIQEDTEIGEVVFTLDWHSLYHCSFTRNGGQWPIHCLQYSQGAGLSQKILNACIEKNLAMKFFLKGTTDWKEEYGAFEKASSGGLLANYADDGGLIELRHMDVEVCGLALDYCVKETIKNLYEKLLKKKLINNLSIFMPGTKAINPNDETIEEFFRSHPKLISIF